MLAFVHVHHDTILLKVYMIYVVQRFPNIAKFAERIWGVKFLSMRIKPYIVAAVD